MPYPQPLPIPTVTFTTINTIPLPFLNPESLLNLPSNFNFLPTDILTATTGSFPAPSLMHAAPAPSPPTINADGSINIYSPNYVPGYAPTNTSAYSPPMLSPAPAPPLAPAPCAPPAPSTPNAAAPRRKCGNCGTTESCKWRNVTSKINIRCNTCFTYRQRNNKDRPAAAIQYNQEIKMKRI
ncbi:hypothetical protein CAEBREN_12291 [Caenorhabditis brenneri]|uniref:GATA-type domain-containing protein n=1 Tax=Caenorhabditis brenneri TaxID=135651 RepID=G0MMF3_CAEBE|nr:hypothetical protein CAEBREN_12291 [Caenorhabditis brenneri]